MIGLIEVHRALGPGPSAPLAAAPSTFLIFRSFCRPSSPQRPRATPESSTTRLTSIEDPGALERRLGVPNQSARPARPPMSAPRAAVLRTGACVELRRRATLMSALFPPRDERHARDPDRTRWPAEQPSCVILGPVRRLSTVRVSPGPRTGSPGHVRTSEREARRRRTPVTVAARARERKRSHGEPVDG